MSKKKTTTDETTEPTPDEIIAEGIQVGLDWIAERFGTKIQWSTPNVATMRSAARIDVARALRPPPQHPPRPPLAIDPPKTTPPAGSQSMVDPRTGFVRRT